jgi:hypothetical protein
MNRRCRGGRATAARSEQASLGTAAAALGGASLCMNHRKAEKAE